MRLRHLRYWRCFFFGHLWTPILDKELQPIYGSGGYRCSRCPFGAGSKEAFLKGLEEYADVSQPGLHMRIDPAAPRKRDE